MAPPLSFKLRDVRRARDDPQRLQEMIQQLNKAIAQDETDEDRIEEYKDLLGTAEEFLFKFLKEPLAGTAADAFTQEDMEQVKIEFQQVKPNPSKLKAFIDNLNRTIDALPYGPKRDFFVGLSFAAQEVYKSLTQPREIVSARDSPRVQDIRFRVKEEKLLYHFDLDQFLMRVLYLFVWHKDDAARSIFMAPYFPLVQSSGTGKTKLLIELWNKIQTGVTFQGHDLSTYECRTILCTLNLPTEEFLYTDHLVITNQANDLDKRKYIYGCLDTILSKCEKANVIFLFDETQFLLESNGFCFRCVRWWLRRIDIGRPVVAVFTGTTSRLSNFYREPPESNFSRDAKIQYHDKGTALYRPFYELCTIGVFATVLDKNPINPNASEYVRSIPYGRPLFALMSKTGQSITKEQEWSILRRMLVDTSPNPRWTESVKACLSILGTRVQMGQTTTTLSSELVSKGYAVLTHFAAATNDDMSHSDNLAQIAFLQDPVCARLAMALMDEDWIINNGPIQKYQGQTKVFWVRTMSSMFSSGLCRPNQGDLGEIAAATYLLFCGDLLRKRLKDNADYITFSVSLADFVLCVIKPEDFLGPTGSQDFAVSGIEVLDQEGAIVDQKPGVRDAVCEVYVEADVSVSYASKATTSPENPSKRETRSTSKKGDDKLLPAQEFSDATVNFIQVVRNYIRFSMTQIADQSFLKGMYESGCAFYLYERFHVIDMVASIRLVPVGAQGQFFYAPLLVSVSTKDYVRSEQEKLNKMEQLMNDAGAFGLCIHMNFQSDGTEPVKSELLSIDDVRRFLRGETVSKVVVVAKNDPFEIVGTLLQMTSMGPARAEVYSSHPFMNSPFLKGDENASLLVRTKAGADLVEYVTDLSTRTLQPDESESAHAQIDQTAAISEDQHTVARKRSLPTTEAESSNRKRRRK